MSKCSKSCMPECKYFTTGGCVSPFNCIYKEESEYINSATSGTVIYIGGMNMPDEKIIEVVNALKANDKTMKDSGISDNLWGKAVECIMFLQSENAALRERLEKTGELPCGVGDKVYCIHRISNPEILEWQVNEIRITDYNYMLQLGRAGTKDYRNEASQFYGKWWFVTREAAEARLSELKGE